MHMKLDSVFLFNFQAEVLVIVGEYFDFQPACLRQFRITRQMFTSLLRLESEQVLK